MTTTGPTRRPLDVVVGVDGSGPSRRALAWAATEARLAGDRLVPVLCWTAVDTVGGEAFRTGFTAEDADRILTRVVAEVLGPDPGVEVSPEVITEAPAKGLVARATGAALLAVGERGRGGFAGLTLGSVSQAAATHATAPTVVCRGEATTHGRVVVGVDGSEGSDNALRWAAAHAARRGATLEVVKAWTSPLVGLPDSMLFDIDLVKAAEDTGQAELDAQVARVLGEVGDDVTTLLTEGPASVALVERAAAADLVVVGPRGLGPLTSRLLGSVTYKLLHHSPCPVAVVPPRPLQ